MDNFDLNSISDDDSPDILGSISDPAYWAYKLDGYVWGQRNALGLTQKFAYQPYVGEISRTTSGFAPVNPFQYSVQSDANVNTAKMEKDKRFTPGFLPAVQALCQKLNIKFIDLMVAMAFESDGTFSSSDVNSSTGATGLIQFMPSTARGLGTTTSQLAAMTQVEQLYYVEKYLLNKNLSNKGFSDIYMSILFPAAVGKSEDFVLFGPGALNNLFATKGYIQNKGLDLDKDGKITKAEAANQAWKIGLRHIKKYT